MLRHNSATAVLGALVITLLAAAVATTDASVPLSLPTKTAKQSAKLPPCKLCTTLAESFVRGMERTARGKHDGGDAAWEEQRLGSYKRSELRLVEIQEALCKDAQRGEDQCHELAETNEALLEEWWQERPDDDGEGDLHRWLCVERLAVCCAADTYGPECKACADCSGNGKCKGAGTRKGNGKCACDTGYRGERCAECDQQYYESFRDETKLLCSVCHVACAPDAGCTGAGPKACRVCREGWRMQPELGGCVDVDECSAEKARCKGNQFCVNNEGSFTCLECDKSCSGCSGDGPDECLACADGFELRDGLCKGE